jgi:hypothetical protein
MDVVREDLRPEPPELTLPLAVTQSEVGGEALAFLDAGSGIETGPELPSEIAFPWDAETIATAVTIGVLTEERFASAMDMELLNAPALPSPRRTFVEPEVMYGRLSAEHAVAPDPDIRPAPGGPPPPPGGRPGAGGSERSADR